MSLFGKILNSACDSSARQADDLMRKGQIKRGDAIRNGTWNEEKQKMYDEQMSKLQDNKDIASYTKDFYNHLHDD